VIPNDDGRVLETTAADLGDVLRRLDQARSAASSAPTEDAAETAATSSKMPPRGLLTPAMGDHQSARRTRPALRRLRGVGDRSPRAEPRRSPRPREAPLWDELLHHGRRSRAAGGLPPGRASSCSHARLVGDPLLGHAVSRRLACSSGSSSGSVSCSPSLSS
jgi:hypothetical protein